MNESKKNINAAYRLSDLIGNAIAQGGQQSQFQTWIAVFKLQGFKGRAQKRLVMRGLDLMHEELDRLVAQLRAMRKPEDTYEELVNVIDSVVTHEQMGQSWTEMSQRLQKAMYPLRMLTNFLPDEETLIDPSEFDKLRDDLSTLERSINEDGVSPEVRYFVQLQIDNIRRVFWEYRIRGIRAFKEGAIEAAPDFIESEIIDQHPDDPFIETTRGIWKRITGFIVTAGKVGTGLAGIYKVYEIAEKSGVIHHH